MPLISRSSPLLLAPLRSQLINFLHKNIKVLKFLNININSNPVLLFLITVGSSSLIGIIYNLIKLINLIKFKLQNKYRYNSNSKKDGFYLQQKSGSSNDYRTIHVPYKKSNLKVKIDKINYDRYEHDKLIFKKFIKDNEIQVNNGEKNWIESKFLKKLLIIWKLILVPKIFHKNTTILLSQMACLIIRTWLSLLVTKLDGQIVKDLIGLQGRSFLRSMIYWFLFAFPASYVNSGIQFLTKRLALNFRTNLIRYCHDLYMDPRLVYYKLQFNNNELNDYKLDFNYIDQYLTEDLKKFSDSLTSLFSNVGKPAIDIVFFAIYLRDNIGNLGILGILLNYFLTGWILKIKSPNFNKIWKIKSHLEGIYYNYNLNLINNCEEISFYKGTKIEKLKVGKIFNNLLNHNAFEILQKFKYGLLEDYILKCIWPAFGYFFSSLPILFNYQTGESSSIKNFIVNKRLMLSMADAGSRLMFSIKDISRLSGVTDRIFTLLVNLHQVHDVNFQYGLSSDTQQHNNMPNIGFGSLLKMNSFASMSKLQAYYNLQNSASINGTIQRSYPGLRFEKIPIIIPSSKGGKSQPLINSITAQINQNDNLLILGKNGIGKSSIVRIIAELWPLYSGLLSKPSNSEVMFISQKSYFINGSLRDQIIYPLTHYQMLQKGITDDDLIEYLNEIGLGYLIDRFGSLDYSPSLSDESQLKDLLIDEVVVNDGKKTWFSLLSGGERQKLIIARILFHNKKFIVLDEPTNAISYDSEDAIFEMLKKKGFTFITISHRDSLLKYHDYLLDLKNNEEFEFKKIDEVDDSDDDDSDSSEQEEEEEEQQDDDEESNKYQLSINPAVKNKQKTKTQRNKQQRHKERVKLEEELKELKLRLKELEKLPDLLSSEPIQNSKNKLSREESELRKVIKEKKKLGSKHLAIESGLEVKLSDELSDSLRKLKPEGNLLYDQMKHLQDSGKIETRKPIKQKQKYTPKISEKWTYKDFKW
ncbi:hypothetical protein CANARDRAFT_198085 [[Candida] arabinofermentans NRRL YB-2248]|uniref:Ribosome biogenesis protein NOP53 n=1 Tax=[Candida] arabinofermentans NRRL YB-2248 TaxID=983967 RepID=A0A1E4T341_9ASCO|nr:hypothetical protein CANARDRAFT_198085 [[Candida] arabinofermentans NRRL YB-2248]